MCNYFDIYIMKGQGEGQGKREVNIVPYRIKMEIFIQKSRLLGGKVSETQMPDNK